ncbi:hypothetical protein [Nocardia amamiensis]|uniref:hypothetical protein n=1 Tax=Nocardia amamiensis TaxID=404578 RepID=UPI0012F483BB|nr:hypothetical protein [Nocardia amamiensis]
MLMHAPLVALVASPAMIGAPVLAAQRFAAEALNPSDAGARWCSAVMLSKLSPLLGK